jgi:hypothetical protein
MSHYRQQDTDNALVMWAVCLVFGAALVLGAVFALGLAIGGMLMRGPGV